VVSLSNHKPAVLFFYVKYFCILGCKPGAKKKQKFAIKTKNLQKFTPKMERKSPFGQRQAAFLKKSSLKITTSGPGQK